MIAPISLTSFCKDFDFCEELTFTIVFRLKLVELSRINMHILDPLNINISQGSPYSLY